MDENTQHFTKPNRENPETASHLFSISVRGWLALILILTICLHSFAKLFIDVYLAIQSGTVAEIEVKEPLYTMGSMALAYYFGQQMARKQP